MSVESVRKILGVLLDDPENDGAWSQLEERAIGGELASLGSEVRTVLEQARKVLAERGEAESAARVLEVEEMVEVDPSTKLAIVRERAKILEEELLDDRAALAALESVKASDADAAEIAARLAMKKEKWKELVTAFKKHAESTADATQIATHLASAAGVILQYKGKGRDKDADTLFNEALSVDPGNIRAIQLYERVLRKRGDRWDDVAKHLERGAAAVVDSGSKVALLHRAARVHAGRRRDFASAEKCYRSILRIDAANSDANRFLVLLLSEQNRSDDLVKLYEDQLRLAGSENDLGLLVQIGMTHWRVRNDPRSATPYFRRLSAMSPGHPLAKSFFDEHPASDSMAPPANDPDSAEIVVEVADDAARSAPAAAEPTVATAVPAVEVKAPTAVLEPAAAKPSQAPPAETGKPAAARPATRTAANPVQKVMMAIDIAKQFEIAGQNEKAIDAWKGVLRLDANEPSAREALLRLYAQVGRWNNVIELLRQELDSLGGAKVVGDPTTLDRRLALLREMAEVYRDKMGLEPMVVQTYNSILALAPDDLDTLQSLGKSYEKLGRHTDLIKVMEQQVEHTPSPAEKIELLRKIASIWVERFNNVNNATKPLEQILTIDAGNVDAITELKDLYTKRRAWRPLFDVVRKEAATLSGNARRDVLVEAAKLAAEKLNSAPDAIAVWREALELDPNTPGALDALEKLTEKEKDWTGLSAVLEQRATEAADDEVRANILMKLGAVYSERLENVAQSIATWRRVLEVKPGQPKALRVLREAYTSAGDWDSLEAMYAESNDYEGLVEVLGASADRATDPATKIALSFRTAGIYENKLAQTQRAFRSYERVLSVDPSNARAAKALVPIYLTDEKWARLAQMYEVLLGNTPATEVDDLLALLENLRDLSATKLADRAAAFRWSLQAFKLRPDSVTLEASLEKSARDAGAWKEFVAAIDERAASISDSAEQARLRDKAATVEADQLGAVDAAIVRYQRSLAADPSDGAVIATLDQLFRRANRYDDLRQLFDHRLARTEEVGEKNGLLAEVAEIEERSLNQPDAAAARYRAILQQDPSHTVALESLSRLAAQAERWNELSALLAQRRDQAEGATRAELAYQLGMLQKDKLAANDAAIESFQQALQLVPQHAASLAALEQLLRTESHRVTAARILEPQFEVTGDWQKLAWALQILLDSATELSERKLLALRLADVFGTKLADAEAGFELVRTIFSEQPADKELADAAERLAQQSNSDEKLVQTLAELHGRDTLEVETKVSLARRAALVLDDRLGRPDAAERFHRTVIDAGGLDQHALERLRALYQQRERWQDLRALYATWIDRTQDDQDRVALLAQDAELVESIVNEPAAAIEQYKKIRAIEPASASALNALERLLTAHARWVELEALYGEWIDVDAALALDLRFRRAKVRAQKLQSDQSALQDLTAVVEAEPSHAGARELLEMLVASRPEIRAAAAAVLERLYEEEGAAQASNLVRMLRVRLETTTDREALSALYRRIAELLEMHLSDAPAAFAAIAQALAASPSSDECRTDLGRLAEAANKNAEAAQAMLSAANDPTTNTSAKVALLRDVAQIYDDRLGDLVNAERTHQQLLGVADDDDTRRSSAEALERIFSAQQNPRGLVDALLLRAKLELDSDARRTLYARAGELQEEQLQNSEAAIESQKARLEIDPSDQQALAALVRLYGAVGQWRSLVGALKASADLTADAAEQKALRLRAAAVLNDKLDARDEAIALYREVLEDFGSDRAVHAALSALYEASEKWVELLEILEKDLEIAETDTDRLRLTVRIAELRRTRTNEALRSVDGYKDALELDHREPTARAALESLLQSPDENVALASARALQTVYLKDEQWDALVGALDRVARDTDDDVERREALARAAELCDQQLRAPDRAFRYAARELRLSVTEPEIGPRLRAVERLANEARLYGEHRQALRDIAADINDADLQLEAHMRIAELSRQQLNDPATAREYYEKSLELKPDHLPALDQLEALHANTQSFTALIDVLSRKIDLAVSDSDRRELLRKQAQVNEEKLNDRPAAARCYESILEMGFDRDAAAALERIYQAEERWSDLSGLLESQLSQSGSDHVELYHRLAVVSAERLNDPDRALEFYKEGITRNSDHAPTIASLEQLGQRDDYRARVAEMLEPVYLSRMDWPKVIAAMETRIAATEDPIERRALLARLGSLYEESMEDLDKGLDTYARMYREDVRDKDSWEIVRRLSRLLNRYDRQAEIYASGLRSIDSDDETTAELCHETAKLFDAHTKQSDAAKEFYRRALAFDPQQSEVFAELEALLKRENSHEELKDLYAEAADQAPDPQRQKKLLLAMAEVQERSLHDAAAAITTFRRVLDVDPADTVATARLDALLTQTKDWAALAELIERRIDEAVDSNERAAQRIRLAQVRAENLEDPSAAVDALEAVVQERPDQQAAIAALERLADQHHALRSRIVEVLEPLYRNLDSWSKLVVVLNARLASTEDPVERGQILREIAALKETRANDVEGAFASYSAAFVADANDMEARENIERLATAHQLWDDLVRAYESAIAGTTDATAQVDLLRAVAETHDQRRDAPRDAIAAYERLFAIDDTQVEALDQLQGLHVLLSDWEGLVSVLERKVERTMDDETRRALLHEIGEYQNHMIGDPAAAIRAYKRALEADPSDVVALEALDDLYSTANDSASLADILRQRLDSESDPAARQSLAVRLGRLYEGPLNDQQQAIEAFKRALDDGPTDSEAMTSLERLYIQTHAHQDLLENLQTQAQLCADEPARNAIRLRIGRLQAQELNEPASALESYRDVLASDRTNAEALAAVRALADNESLRAEATALLEPLLRESQRWDELASVLELKLTTVDDPQSRRDELRGLASVHEHGRRDGGAAFEAYRRAAHDDPGHADTLASLERLAESLNRWSDVASIYEDESAVVSDATIARDLAVRAATIAATRLLDDTRAIASYRQALAQGDEDVILAALEEIYRKHSRWDDVAEVLERRIVLAGAPEELDPLEIRLAMIRLERFNNAAGALSSLRSVCERSPNNADARLALESLLEVTSVRADVIEALESTYLSLDNAHKLAWLKQLRVADATSASERVRLLGELSGLREERLNDVAGALAAMIEALESDPTDETTLAEIERLAHASGQWASLRGAVERAISKHSDLDSVARAGLHFRAARWYRDQLQDDAAAEARLRDALATEPEHLEAIQLLELIHRASGREKELVTTLRRRAEVELDVGEKKRLLREAAQVAEQQLADVDAAAEITSTLLENDDSDLEGLEQLARLRALQGRHAAVAELLSKRARLVDDPMQATALRRQVAELYAGPINNFAQAIAAYKEILEFDPSDQSARTAIEQLLEANGKHRELEEALRSRVENAMSAEERNATRVRLAKLAEGHFAQPDRAIDYLREVLDESPNDNLAGNELERLYSSLKRWADLADLLERRAQDAADAGNSAGELAALVRIGALNEKELNNRPKAVELYERVLDRDPNHAGALASVARLAEADNQWDRAAEMLERVVSLAAHGREGAEAAMRLASIRGDRQQNDAAAEAALRRALELDRSQAVIDRLKALAVKRGSTEMLVEMLEHELVITTDKNKQIALHRELASLYRDKLANAGSAAGHLEQARVLAPEDKELLLPLVDVYLAAGRQRDALPVIEAIIASFGGRRSKELATWHHRLGQAQEALGDNAAALAQFDAAFKIDLTNVPILRDLGLLCYKSGDLDRAQKTFRALLLQKLDASSGITKSDVYFYLGDTLRLQNDNAKAIGMLERAVEADKANTRATELLARLKSGG
jgi:tetratricopeptide (TPR) repeat protein